MNRMFMYEKESAPFMRPVDPVLDQCPVGSCCPVVEFLSIVDCDLSFII